MHWDALLVALPPLLLLAAGFTPSRWANRNVGTVCCAAMVLTVLAFGSSAAAAFALGLRGPLDAALVSLDWPLPLNFGVYYDSLAAVMQLLISFVGMVIARYSVRYLDGEATQGRFLRWMLFTLGAVLLMVVSRNLVMFTVAWMLTSAGLHQLLTHYPDRPWAIWAARKKFLISRLGDVMLIVALALTYYCFGSFDYKTVFANAVTVAQSAAGGKGLISLIGTLFVVGAMTKSAQFPFHSWLPDTMETPTPVSALMHAGIINGGGFLVLRLSPLISMSPVALDFLAVVGATTAIFGGVVMLTQTSVKRSLAYSTIAQMGFMMLQCGLGAFSAALLHIVAHSLYKAHAFLSSGSVLDSAARLRAAGELGRSVAFRPRMLPLAVAISLGLCLGAAWTLGVNFSTKPGAGVLGLILVLALTQLLWIGLSTMVWKLAVRTIVWAALVSFGYCALYQTADWILAGSSVGWLSAPSPLAVPMVILVAAGFSAVFALQVAVALLPRHALLQSLYVHAMHGFYVDIPARRATALLWGRSAPVP
ncbi:MAG: oxidoreductase [Pirellulaceae bacterium]|nr:oxidoreductase [Pirellulaceae bacterium]